MNTNRSLGEVRPTLMDYTEGFKTSLEEELQI